MRVNFIALIAIAVLPSEALAQAVELRSGLQNRVVAVPGVVTEYDNDGFVNAGYYRIIVEDSGSSNAAICPKTKYGQATKAEKKRWRSTENLIYNKIFDKNVSWTLVGEFALASPEPEPVQTILRFASIQDAEESSCTVKIGGDGVGVNYRSFLVPINRNLYHFGETVNLTIKVNHSDKADKGRVSAAWGGLSLGVSAIIPGAGALLETAAPTAEKEIDKLLDHSNAGHWTVALNYSPGKGQRASAYYLDLGFFHDKLQANTSGNSGVNIKIDYVGSVFSSGKFLAPIAKTPSAILATNVQMQGGISSIPTLLGAEEYANIKAAATVGAFDAGCSTALAALLKQGLSETDATIFLRAVAMQNEKTKDALHELTCLTDRNALLTAVGMKIESPIALPDRTRASLGQAHDGMNFLGAILQTGATNPTFEKAFADQVTLFMDGPAQRVMGLEQLSWSGSRTDFLQRMASHFSNIGCYSPRLSRPDLRMASRPSIRVVRDDEFVSAALLKVREQVDGDPSALAAVLIYDGAVGTGSPQISFVSLTAPAAEQDGVLAELTQKRRPESCTETWMDNAFAL